MTIPGSANPLLLKAPADGGGGEYTIERSVRFNSSDSAYLSRTPASAGNRKTWTWAGWVKRSGGAFQMLFNCDGGTSDTTFGHISISSTDQIRIAAYFTIWRATAAVFRDFSAWYHIVVSFDTTQATANNRVRLYVNGTEVTTFSTLNNPAQNTDYSINQAAGHNIGRSFGSYSYYNGYLADVHFIDGQALDPTSFGEFDDNGIWQPIAYSGSYGTNGFHLDFSDNSTAAALGTDTSGNGNTWTVNNISVTAGAGNDSLVDVPTNGTETDTGVGGEVRGNYCTWNPLENEGTLANGNLDFASAVGLYQNVRATFGINSGKYYWEVTSSGGADLIGVSTQAVSILSVAWFTDAATGWGYYYTGQKYNNSSGAPYGAAYGANDVIGVAFDRDNGTLTFYKNGVSQGQAYSGLTTGTYFPSLANYNSASAKSTNFGQRPFAYTAPSGFKALCTANLPAPVITNPSEYFDVVTYTGSSSPITISGLAFSPDLVWSKNRSTSNRHGLIDSVRGVNLSLASNLTNAELLSQTDLLTSFTSDGYTIGVDAGQYGWNWNGQSFVNWAWDAGSSTVTNTDGSITSQVRANPSAGFSIVGYTGTSASATVGHGLGVRPVFMIIKNRSTSGNWTVLSDWTYPGGSVAQSWNNRRLKLNTTNAYDGTSAWNNATIPTSSVFYLGKPSDVNRSGNLMVAYCFAPVDGYSSFGSYTGNGSADGTFVFTNHRPRWILLKRTDTTSNWTIIDTAREGYNVDNDPLYPNLNNAESTTDLADILSNGFKLRSADASVNANAGTYIFASFAENPFSLARAR